MMNVREVTGYRGTNAHVFVLMQLCNFHCESCNHPEVKDTDFPLQYRSGKEVANRIMEFSDEGITERIMLTFNGGEPLMHMDDIFEILDNLVECKYPIEVSVYTNSFSRSELNNFVERYNSSMFGKLQSEDCGYINSLRFHYTLKVPSDGEYESEMQLNLKDSLPNFVGVDDLCCRRKAYEYTEPTYVQVILRTEEDIEHFSSILNKMRKSKYKKSIRWNVKFE